MHTGDGFGPLSTDRVYKVSREMSRVIELTARNLFTARLCPATASTSSSPAAAAAAVT